MLENSGFPKYHGPVLVVIMDGVGLCGREAGNAVRAANTPTLDRLFANYPNTVLKAHGTAVGLPSDDDMGNSEVGHNAMGAGKVYHQGAMLVNSAIATGKMFESAIWKDIVSRCAKGRGTGGGSGGNSGGGSGGNSGGGGNAGTLHFIGLFSDGNVHSHIDHLKAMIVRAKQDGIANVRIHALLDGRDVGETSALDYVRPFEEFLAGISADGDFTARIASGGGRMKITMDRYEANWGMVELGWKTHVLAEGRQFPTAEAAITAFRSEAKVIDQDLPPFVIADNGVPAGPIVDGDAVILYNFRGDRAIEISKAFTYEDFNKFDRVRMPDVIYAGMLEYDGDLHIPSNYLVSPPEIHDTLGEHLCASNVKSLAISETQKFGHVTYFWNGNRSGKFSDALETYIEVPSDIIPFEQRPWMKAAESTDALIKELTTADPDSSGPDSSGPDSSGGRGYDFARINYANGDMVGHTGDFDATIIAVEAVDLCLARLLPIIDSLGGMAIITADHGNADEMYELDKKSGQPAKNKDGSMKAKTSHTLNPVPCIFYDNAHPGAYSIAEGGNFGLSNLASTIALLLGFSPFPGWDPPIIKMNE